MHIGGQLLGLMLCFCIGCSIWTFFYSLFEGMNSLVESFVFGMIGFVVSVFCVILSILISIPLTIAWRLING